MTKPRTEKTGKKQPLAYTTKTGKFDPYVFGHSVLLLVAQWGQFRVPLAVRVLDPQVKGQQNLLVREWLRKFVPPTWCSRVVVEADAGFAAKATLGLLAELGYFYVFALPRTWKTRDQQGGKHLRDIARHTNKRCYRRVASYKPDGRRCDYWTVREESELAALGEVTLVLSKRRFNDPPRKIKLLVRESPRREHGHDPELLRPAVGGGNLPDATYKNCLVSPQALSSDDWQPEGQLQKGERNGCRLLPLSRRLF